MRRKGTICLLLALVLYSHSIFAQNLKVRIDAVNSALQSKDFDKALELLQPALKASPENAQLWSMQGTAYAGKTQTKEALSSFRKALKLSPDYLPALEGAAQIGFEASDPAAIPIIERILRLRPKDTTSHGMLAVLQYQQGKWADAVTHFENAGSLFESQPSALHAYATCLVKLKQYDKAIKIFESTVALNPQDPHERQLLSAIQLMANQPNDALATLEPLLQTTPDASTLELAARVYEANKDTSRAVSTLQQAILLDPTNVDLYVDFASICYTHGSFQVGVDVVNDGLALQPNAAPLYFARGILYIELAQFEKGEADFEKANELDPSQSLSAAAQGIAAAQRNDFDRALAKIQESLAQQPNDPLMLYLQADILAAKNADVNTPDFQLAMRSAQKAVVLRPSLGAAHGVLAKLYMQSEKYPEAIEQCRKALAIDPSDQTVVYRLIQALRKTGDKKSEIPDLLKKLAQLREQAIQKDKERYRFKLVD
jgi:tetratricopeptide (TPR) repeat protein